MSDAKEVWEAAIAMRTLLGGIHDYGIDLEDGEKRAEFCAVLDAWDAAERADRGRDVLEPAPTVRSTGPISWEEMRHLMGTAPLPSGMIFIDEAEDIPPEVWERLEKLVLREKTPE